MDWQERLLAERMDLDYKRLKLIKFIDDAAFKALAEEDQDLLKEQLAHMTNYSLVLEQRIGRFL